uniref:Acetylcholine receptor subunit alpha-like 2-like n=1 Tax=Saccoglossus kowalevskii TaxID=10224 RepID=A0ABM0M4B3_SACKO
MTSRFTVVCWICILAICFTGVLSTGSIQHKSRLYGDLLMSYHKLISPQDGNETQLVVKMALSVGRLYNIDSENMVKVGLYKRFKWNDHRLQWDSSKYGNIVSLHLPVSVLWNPEMDIHLKHGTEQYTDSSTSTNAIVDNTGDISLFTYPATRTQVQCENSATKDQYVCSFVYILWTYDSTEIELDLMEDGAIETDLYKESLDWKLVGNSSERLETYSPDNRSVKTHELVYSLIVKRNQDNTSSCVKPC